MDRPPRLCGNERSQFGELTSAQCFIPHIYNLQDQLGEKEPTAVRDVSLMSSFCFVTRLFPLFLQTETAEHQEKEKGVPGGGVHLSLSNPNPE